MKNENLILSLLEEDEEIFPKRGGKFISERQKQEEKIKQLKEKVHGYNYLFHESDDIETLVKITKESSIQRKGKYVSQKKRRLEEIARLEEEIARLEEEERKIREYYYEQMKEFEPKQHKESNYFLRSLWSPL